MKLCNSGDFKRLCCLLRRYKIILACTYYCLSSSEIEFKVTVFLLFFFYKFKDSGECFLDKKWNEIMVDI